MYIPPSEGRDGRRGTAGGGDLNILPPENGRTVHFDQDHYEPVLGSGAETGGKDIQAVMGIGQIGFGRDADGGSGGGTGGGGIGDGWDGGEDGLNWWGDNVANITLGTETNDPLAYAPVLEHHHPIMSTLGETRGRLEIERETEMPRDHPLVNIKFKC